MDVGTGALATSVKESNCSKCDGKQMVLKGEKSLWRRRLVMLVGKRECGTMISGWEGRGHTFGNSSRWVKYMSCTGAYTGDTCG